MTILDSEEQPKKKKNLILLIVSIVYFSKIGMDGGILCGMYLRTGMEEGRRKACCLCLISEKNKLCLEIQL